MRNVYIHSANKIPESSLIKLQYNEANKDNKEVLMFIYVKSNAIKSKIGYVFGSEVGAVGAGADI